MREAIQAVGLEHRRRYGYRRVTRGLRRGWLVNHKRVARLMSQDNLLAVQPRAPQTDTSTRSYIMLEVDGRSQPDPARSYVIIYVIGDSNRRKPIL